MQINDKKGRDWGGEIFFIARASALVWDLSKQTKIIPAFKGDDAKGAGDYRPISLLYTYNTISEKLMFTRISKFIDEYDFLFDSQCGFLTKHDIQHAILDIINTIQCNMDQGKYSFGIFIDLKKRLLR